MYENIDSFIPWKKSEKKDIDITRIVENFETI